MQHDLRTAIFRQLQRLDFARHDELSTGQLVSRASSDVRVDPGLPAVPAHRRGEHAAVPRIADSDVHLVGTARARDAGSCAAAARHRDEAADVGVPGQLGRAAKSRRRRQRGRGGRDRRASREGIRPGGPRAPTPRRPVGVDVRLPRAAREHPGPAAAGDADDPRLRSGRRSRTGWLARAAPPHHLRHVLRVRVVHAADHAAGATARRDPHRRPAGPGRRRTHLRPPRLDAARPGPGGRAGAARGAGRGRVRPRHVRLHVDGAGAARLLAHGRAGRDGRARRRFGFGQVDGRALAAPLLRRAFGIDLDRRRRRTRRDPAVVAGEHRRGVRGFLPLFRLAHREHRVRPTLGDSPRGRDGGARGRGARVHHAAPLRLRHRRGRAGADVVGRPTATGRAGARVALRSGDPVARRRDVVGRRPDRGGDPRDPAPDLAQPHHTAHRPPAVDAVARRSHRRGRQGSGRRRGDERRADRALSPVPDALVGTGRRRRGDRRGRERDDRRHPCRRCHARGVARTRRRCAPKTR